MTTLPVVRPGGGSPVPGDVEDAVAEPALAPRIRFDAPLLRVRASTLVRLPKAVSTELPSRGQVAVHGTVNGVRVETVLEPDGEFGHWMRIDRALQRAADIGAGDTAAVDLAVSKEWPEPEVPADLGAAIASAPSEVRDLWIRITPMARWEWVRWVNATGNPDTRRRRVEVSISKMQSGKRRPCCFNLAACTDPAISRSGRLIAPAGA